MKIEGDIKSRTAVTRERSDKLAKQVYTFQYDMMTHELVLDSYKYCERLSRYKKYVVVAQWERSLQDAGYFGIDIRKIPLDDQIKEAARTLFVKGLAVVKVPKQILDQIRKDEEEDEAYEEQIQRAEDEQRGRKSGKIDRLSGQGDRPAKKGKK